ncbi:serine/threonine-protein kinase [Tautonia rosea]|uniref:serine/threonine-protein kinase n=1 Tax=Tautonia rosea TaxID=2728037 RepID=UPI0014748429|nr:serine/threonine-protein kinase [Tautonia rosea]
MSEACPTSTEVNQFLRASDDQIQADPRLHSLQLHILGCSRCLEHLEGEVLKVIGPELPTNASAFFGRAAMSAEPVGLAPKIEGFVMGDRLGRGGMGTVFKAWQSAMHREVAIKVLPGGPLADPRWRAWCLAEARAAAQIRHPDAVQVYDVGMTEGYPYLVMEYVAGGSLADRLRKIPSMPFRDSARLLARIARVVHHMHLRGLIHRDLKPGNILIDSPSDAPPSVWWPKVADFGLARPIGDSARSLTLAGIGTPEYMAPELAQGRGANVETFADIYALGAILYRLLVGKPPFQEASPQETLARVIEGSPIPPGRIVQKLPRDLETIVLKCLEPEPQRRYATAEALADDLDAFLEGRTILARPVGPVRRSSRFVRRHPVGSALMLGLALTTATSLVLLGRAETARSQAAANEALALERSREAEKRRAEAEANRQQAEQMFQAAGKLLAIVNQGDDPNVPRGELSRTELEAALPTCRELLRGRPNDLVLLRTYSQIVYQIGWHRALEGRTSQAADLFREGVETLDAALANVQDDDLRHEAAFLSLWYGQILYTLEEIPEAIQFLHRSLEWCDGPTESWPLTSNQRRAAFIKSEVGPHLILCGDHTGRRTLIEAKRMLEGHLEAVSNDVDALAHLVNVYHDLGESDEALVALRRLVSIDRLPRYRYHLASALDIRKGTIQDEVTRGDLTAEIADLIESCLPELQQEADNNPSKPEFAETLHHAFSLSIRSLLDLGRSDEAVDVLAQFLNSIETRPYRFPEPNSKIDHFYATGFNELGRILIHPALPEQGFQEILTQIEQFFDQDSMTSSQRKNAMFGLLRIRFFAQSEFEHIRIAAFFEVCHGAVTRHFDAEKPSIIEITELLAWAMTLRIHGHLGDSERIIAWCGKALEAMPSETRVTPEYFVALSDYWTQVAKNLWRYEPIDETALGDALRRSVESAEKAARFAPEEGVYRELVAERRERLERSGLDPGPIAQRPGLEARSSSAK